MTALLVQIAVGVVLGLIAAWIKGPTPATFEQPRRPELKSRLLHKLHGAGWVLVLCLLLQGCRQTAVYIPSGEPVRITEEIKGATVEVIGPDGTVIRKMDIPAGWYALPDDVN